MNRCQGTIGEHTNGEVQGIAFDPAEVTNPVWVIPEHLLAELPISPPPTRRGNAVVLAIGSVMALLSMLAGMLLLTPNLVEPVIGKVVAVAAEEDQPGWSCVDDGNKVCGPGNPEGVPAGRYDEGGVLIDPWPVMN